MIPACEHFWVKCVVLGDWLNNHQPDLRRKLPVFSIWRLKSTFIKTLHKLYIITGTYALVVLNKYRKIINQSINKKFKHCTKYER